MTNLLLYPLIALLAGTPLTITFPDLGETAYQQALKDAKTNWRLMCFAAHPDDEDGATLAYYRYHCGVETHAVIATRGEGGQNEIGPELYEELAVIRTKEMQAAAEVEGAQLHFLDLPDFGYSKTIEETQEIWGEEETLRRVVYMIRKYKPHVIITHHGRMKDHGHHQALGKAVIDAFDVAGDPDVFPEMHDEFGISPWQPLRLFIRDFAQGDSAIVTDISQKDELRGVTYAEIAADALRLHKSQGMEYFIERLLTGNPKTYYDLVKHHDSPMPEELDEAAPLFGGMENRADPVTTSPWWFVDEAVKVAERPVIAMMENAVHIEASIDDSLVVPGQSVKGDMRIYSANDARVLVKEVRIAILHRDPSAMNKVSESSNPVWKNEDNFSLGSFSLRINPLTELNYPPEIYGLRSEWSKENFSLLSTAVSIETIGVTGGQREFPLYIAPPIFAQWQNEPYLYLPDSQNDPIITQVHIHNYHPGANDATIEVNFPEQWSKSPEIPFSFSEEDEEKQLDLPIQLPDNITPGDYPISVQVEGMPEPETTLIRVVDVEVPKDKYVGVVQSYDDTFVKTLERLGVKHKTIEAEDFNAETLDQFTTIIVDIRAYAKRPDLVENNDKILDYCKRGGTVLCMYQKTFEWPESGYAPYPIRLSRNRVTIEEAPMEVLAPEHALFSTPNKITDTDWDGWIQERGLYFPDKWDDAFTPLLKCEDPGETIPPGSCLIADYGEGKYLYTALGWYRQLREVHPGCIRIFANMLAL